MIDKQNQVINELRASIDALGNNTAQSSEKLFYTTLANLEPEWETINTDPRFIKWLGVTEPYTGLTRKQALDNAASTLDAQRAAFFFTSFKESVKKPTPQISPNTSTATNTPSAEKTFSTSEVNKFYSDVTKGKYKHDLEAMKQKENDITRAQMEGRIRA